MLNATAPSKKFSTASFLRYGLWLGGPPTRGDKLLSNKQLILGNLTLGNPSPKFKKISTVPFLRYSLGLGAPPTQGINSCQINNWFWVIWVLTHPRHLKIFLPCRFWDTASDWERRLHRGITCCQINNGFLGNFTLGNPSPPFKKNSTVPFLRYSFWLGASPMPGDRLFFKKRLIWGDMKVLNARQPFTVCMKYTSRGITLSPGWSWGITHSDLAYYIISWNPFIFFFVRTIHGWKFAWTNYIAAYISPFMASPRTSS